MNRKQQAKFVRELSKSVADEIIAQLKKTPETEAWDGHELRVLLAERHQSSAYMSCIKDEPRSKRAMNYRNVITCNL
jgi:hypothetical protein